MSICARTGCLKRGLNRCSVCLREPYCSSDCQKGDWKSHKSICKILKKLSLQLQSYHEAARVIEEIQEEVSNKKQEGMRLLVHVISYSEHQFGNRVQGKTYRERGNGERIDNWKVEIVILISLYNNFLEMCYDDESLTIMCRNDMTLPYYEKMLDLLRPWSAYLDLSSTIQVGLNKFQIKFILMLLSEAQSKMGAIYKRRNEFNVAENHYQQALSYARLYEGTEEEEIKTTLLCCALRGLYDIRRDQGNYADALPFAEESYDFAAVAYNPVHKDVLEAAGVLIEGLINKGDYYDAQRLAQVTFEAVKDPANELDQQSEAVATGYYDLGRVILAQQGDFMKAERLVRESLRIRTCLYDNNHANVGCSGGLLASILIAQGQMDSEVHLLLEHSLDINIRNYGSGVRTADSLHNLGNFYYRRAEGSISTELKAVQLQLSRSQFNEAVQIYIKIYGPDNPKTVETFSNISSISRQLSEL